MNNSNTKPKGATSYKETAFGIIPRSKLLELELEGTKKGLVYLYELVKGNKKTLITPQLICELHNKSFGWIFPDWAGKYRAVQVTYSGKEAPLYSQVPELTVNMCRDLAEQLQNLPDEADNSYIGEVVKLLAWFQHRFVVIHPFKDYNGRTARMLTSYILISLTLPPIEITAETNEDRKKYLAAMQSADKGNMSPLESLIGSALSQSIRKI